MKINELILRLPHKMDFYFQKQQEGLINRDIYLVRQIHFSGLQFLGAMGAIGSPTFIFIHFYF